MNRNWRLPKFQKEEKVDLAILLAIFCGLFTVCTRTSSLSVSLLIFGTVAIIFHQMYWRRRRLPPGPTPLPFVGNIFSLNIRHPAQMFSHWHAQYGPIFTVWLPQPMVVLASHDVLKETLIKQGPIFAGRPMGYIWTMFTKNTEFGDGIILCEGDRWQEIRDFAHKIFRTFGLGKTMMEERIVRHIEYMTNYIDSEMKGKEEQSLDIEEPLSLCVANIIQDIIMSKSYRHGDVQFRKFKELIDHVLADVTSKSVQLVNTYPILAHFPFMFSALQRFKDNGFKLTRFFLHEIHDHMEHLGRDGEPRDFMEAFLREMKYNQKENPHFNIQTLSIAAGDLWTGGMETTVTTIRWALIYMIYYPSVQSKCRAEIDRIFGNEQPSYASRKELPYVEATLAEVQRIVNVLPWAIPHRTREDAFVSGYAIPKGTIILAQYGTVMFDPHYFPDPEAFLPERFLDENGYHRKRPEMNPFGMGKRSCLGENLARYEMFLLFTTLLQKYEFRAIEGQQLPSLDRSEGMTNVPKRFRSLVKKRNGNIPSVTDL